MVDTILGTRIRQQRREAGITQTELARRVGISASYLNLIEWNKRRIAGSLLRKIAEGLGLELEDLGGLAERRLHGTLNEILHMPALRDVGVEGDRINELIGRFPGWARGVATLAHSAQDANARAQVLSDRLSNDPYLADAVHKMLNRISVIRSSTEILTEYPDIPEDRHDRFIAIINEEIRVLSDSGEALASYLDKAEHAEKILTPIDEVEGLFDAHENHFLQIEQAAANLTPMLSDRQQISHRDRARALVAEHVKPVIENVIDQGPQVETASARDRARRMLFDYAVGAVLMPMETFSESAADLLYDVEALSETFSIEVETVNHRLTALPRREGVPKFGYLRANAAGMIVEMLGLEGLTIPRYAAACPLWVLFRAQQSPEAIIRQRALFPSGDRFIFVARARNTGRAGFGKPRHYLTDMLIMTESDAALTVYAPDPSAIVEEVGPSCRLCPRQSCAHRVEDPITQ